MTRFQVTAKTFGNYAAETFVKVAKKSITILHINIVSLPKNFDALKLFLSQFVKAVDAICISETRLTDSKAKFCNLAGYQLFFVIQTPELVAQQFLLPVD